MDSIRIKRGDIYPTLYKLTWEESGDPIDLTNAKGITMLAVNDETEEQLFETPKTVEIYGAAINGEVLIRWVDGDTDVSGMYRVEFKIEWNDSSILTVPSADIIWMLIMSDLTPPPTP